MLPQTCFSMSSTDKGLILVGPEMCCLTTSRFPSARHKRLYVPACCFSNDLTSFHV